jgi:hypothetical protein
VLTKIHKADATWLEQPKNNWPDAAHSYWRGEMYTTPETEILVQGQLYFPAWETLPLIGDLAPKPTDG